MTAQLTENDPNMSFLINSKAEARLWGHVTERGAKRNRRMMAVGYSDHDGHMIAEDSWYDDGTPVNLYDYIPH